MDEQSWVPVNLIAGFNKVSCLTDNLQLILDAMQKSTVMEVQGDKMRRRNDWMRWLILPYVQDSLGSQLQGIRLDKRASVA
ncbi:la-related protein 1B-like [Bidens hawaiensis]|uniref:la-related protein 1B-like n=1 Tax=Bidens hawaiensis TaxID=980011 RepID=UPI00404913DF